ncbi:MAG: NUDIX hydrolase [Actinobacteria bacterium]|nr:NUDIX hydrolase [Actinomycetota bacterium]MCL5883686.1 NUDIX hydrolase [Actinomycetota bacterium]
MKNRVISSEYAYQGRIIRLRLDQVELPDGRHTLREVMEHPGAAVIVPVDSDGAVRLVRQYRDAVGKELLELPAGKLKPGEDPAECARRELREELGLTAGKLTHLTSFYSSPGFCDEILHVFLAEDLAEETEEGDHEEFIEPGQRPLEPLASLLAEFEDGKSLIGVMLAHRELANR